MKFFSFACAAILVTSTAADALPGTHTDMCVDKLQSSDAGPFVVFEGDWSGLLQTAIIPTAIASGETSTSTVIFAATAAKPEWGVEGGCVLYTGTFDGRTFRAEQGQRSNETVTYTLRSPSTIHGQLTAPGIENSAVMNRVGRLSFR